MTQAITTAPFQNVETQKVTTEDNQEQTTHPLVAIACLAFFPVLYMLGSSLIG